MKISSAQLEAFYAVAQTLNFSRAGERVGVSQSAISQRLANLEYELGATLVLRDSANPRLTETGEKLLRYCETHHQMETDLLALLKTDQKLGGILRVGGFSSVMRSLVVPALAQTMRENPALALALVSREIGELLALLRRSEVDMILTSVDPGKEEIVAELLGYEENVLVEAKKYSGIEIYLDHDPDDSTTTEYFKLLKKKPKAIQRRYLDDVYGLIEGVRNGYGQAVLPRHLIREDDDFRVLNPKVALKTPVYLAYYRQPFYSRVQTATMKTIADSLREKLNR